MTTSFFEPVRPGVWTLVRVDPAPLAGVLVDGVPTDDYYDRPDVVEYFESVPLRPLEGW